MRLFAGQSGAKIYQCIGDFMQEKKFQFPNYAIGAEILGTQDRVLKLITNKIDCHIISRGGELIITGEDIHVDNCVQVLEALLELYNEGCEITNQQIKLAIDMIVANKRHVLQDLYADTIGINTRGKAIKAKTLGQKQYIDSIRQNTITFGIGPAGTGKTFLAVTLAAFYLKNREVERIILTRPAVEAGEKLGYLPGDLQEKVDPYLRPLYDALNDMFGVEQVQRFMMKGTIEVAPLAYMRGRTLDKAFIILDEAQNTTPEQMKMFLTRLGNNSKMVINGDKTQVDLLKNTKSGLNEAERILQNIKDISMIYLTDKDVVRHDLVARIIKAYEAAEKD